MRNTFANVLSKNQVNYQNPGGSAALPAMDPASTANYYSQLGGLYAGYQNQLIGLKQQRVGIRAGFGEAKASIRSQLVSGLADTQNAAIDRGVGGSSAALQQEAGVRGDAAAATATAKRQELEGIGQTRLQAQQAGIDYFQGSQQLEAQKLAQQQQQLASQLQNNLIVSGQETQMDALRAMYRAQMQAFQNGGGNGGNGNGNGGQGSNFDLQAWQQQQAKQAGYGKDMQSYLQNIWASRTGA
jgi:hypothetical protein